MGMADNRRSSRVRICGGTLTLALVLLTGCDTLFRNRNNDIPSATIAPPTLPGKAGAQRVSQYVFYSDTPIKPNAPLFEELSQLRDQIFHELQLPPSNTIIQVYLFDEKDRYERYMKFRYPNLPERRAFFVAHPGIPGGPRELYVFTYWGDQVRQDLRHELTHALVNSVLREVPLWLDEGIAEFFETPPERNGLNLLHLDAIKRRSEPVDLAALEKLDQVPQMGRPQYQEAWAWTHLMLRSTPQARAVLLGYLQSLRDPKPPAPLLPLLREVYPAPADALARHLAAHDQPAATIRPVSNRR